MSLGVNVLIELCRRAVTLFGGEFDIEIVEKHHHTIRISIWHRADDRRRDQRAGRRAVYLYLRPPRCAQPRGAQELGISAVRGGGIVGDHDVLFCGPEEVVTLSHRAQSRGVFADGAVQAALFLDGQAPGYYTMSDSFAGEAGMRIKKISAAAALLAAALLAGCGAGPAIEVDGHARAHRRPHPGTDAGADAACADRWRFSATGDNLIHEGLYNQARDRAGGEGYDFTAAYEPMRDFYAGFDVNWAQPGDAGQRRLRAFRLPDVLNARRHHQRAV